MLGAVRVGVTATRSASEQVGLLRRHGASVVWSPVLAPEHTSWAAESVELLDAVAHRRVDALTFTSTSAVRALLRGAEQHGMTELVLTAMREHVAVVCSGVDTQAALDAVGVRAAATAGAGVEELVALLARVLPAEGDDATIRLNDGRLLTVGGSGVLVDDCPVRLTPAPAAVLRVLAQRPGHVVGRAELLGSLPSGTAGSEHAVETAVARLRQAVGSAAVQTLVKRGYRLAVG